MGSDSPQGVLFDLQAVNLSDRLPISLVYVQNILTTHILSLRSDRYELVNKTFADRKVVIFLHVLYRSRYLLFANHTHIKVACHLGPV